eukprot:Hpha_TRINITY_DN36103_c0_g1::TRINITY_DN36103_c0_g1_i1::g.36158::m.36158
MTTAERELWWRVRTLEALVLGPLPNEGEEEEEEEGSASGGGVDDAASERPLAERVSQVEQFYGEHFMWHNHMLHQVLGRVKALESISREALVTSGLREHLGWKGTPGELSHHAKLRHVLEARREELAATVKLLRELEAPGTRQVPQFKGLADLPALLEEAARAHAEEEERLEKVRGLRQRLVEVAGNYRQQRAVAGRQLVAQHLVLSQWEEVVSALLVKKGLPPLSEMPLE